MSDVNVISSLQRIVVEPASQTISVFHTGPKGPQGETGPSGPTGATGATGASGTMSLRTGTSFPVALYNGERFFRTDLNRPFVWSATFNEWLPDFVNKKALRKYGNASASTTSGAYVDWPATSPLSFTFTKYAAATDLIVSTTHCGYISTPASSMFLNFGFRINAVSHGVSLLGLASGVRMPTHHDKAVLGFAAGTHTFCLVLSVGNTAVTYVSDVNDALSLAVEEVWPQSPAQ